MTRSPLLRSPAVLAAAAAYGLSLLLAGLWCAAPLSLLVASVTGHAAGGDAKLFEPGGAFLIEVVRLNAPAFSAAARLIGLLFVLTSFLFLAPVGILTTATALPSLSLRSLSRTALGHMPSFVLLGGVCLLARGVATVVLVLFGGALLTLLETSLSEAASDWLIVAAVVVFVASQGVIGVCFDFARQAAVQGPCSALTSLPVALECLLKRPCSHLSRRLLIAGVSWCGPLVAGLVTAETDLNRSGAWPLLGVAALHQAAIVWLLCCRCWWLGHTAKAVRELPGLLSLERLDGTAGQTGVPDAPSPDLGASRGA